MKQLIRREGELPLKFSGNLIAFDSERSLDRNNRPDDYWSEYRLFKTDGNQYVLSIEHHSKWANHRTYYFAFYDKDPQKVFEQANNHECAIRDEDEVNRIIQLLKDADIEISESID